MPTLATWFRAGAWFWSPDNLYLLSMGLTSQAGFSAEELDSLYQEFCSKSASILMGSLVSEPVCVVLPKTLWGVQQEAPDPSRGLTITWKVSKAIYRDRCCGSLPACLLLPDVSSYFGLCCSFLIHLLSFFFRNLFSLPSELLYFAVSPLISLNILVFGWTFYNI